MSEQRHQQQRYDAMRTLMSAIATNERLAVLMVVASSDSSMSLDFIATRTALSLSEARAALATLKAHELVDDRDRGCILGPRASVRARSQHDVLSLEDAAGNTLDIPFTIIE